jgi:hypothetical protein
MGICVAVLARGLVEQHAGRSIRCQTLHDELGRAERYVARRQTNVDEQREIVASLTREGKDARIAMQILAQFEEALALFIADRDRLRSLAAGLGVKLPAPTG